MPDAAVSPLYASAFDPDGRRRTSAGSAGTDHDLARQEHEGFFRHNSTQNVKQVGCGHDSHLEDRDADCGQWWREVGRAGIIVNANDTKRIWDGHVAFAQKIHRSDGHDVVAGEHCCWRRIESQ